MILTMNTPVHKPVLLHEVITALNLQPGGKYIDCTLGLGGHAVLILENMNSEGRLLAIDADTTALHLAKNRLSQYSKQIIFINDNFVNLQDICAKCSFFPVKGIIFDLGMSSLQIDTPERGFSFQADSQPDMRFGTEQSINAMDLLNLLPEAKIAQLLWEFGEEPKSRVIARKIVENRPINSTLKLAQIIVEIAGGRGKIHPATRTFLALRIAVNHELENLEKALNQAITCLDQGGRLAVISYHSLEDRLVKYIMKRESSQCVCPSRAPVCTCGHIPSIREINRKVITPNYEEMNNNPRSRSAKLRVIEKL